ncbi:MAG: CPBP family intramembrane metalloprotease [Ignavibacterium sp.]|jgi:hypothetical protein
MMPHPAESAGPERPAFIERHRINPIIFAVVSLAIVFVLYQIVAGTITFLIVGEATVTRENVDMIRGLTMAGQIVCILIPTIALARLLSVNLSDVFRWRLPSVAETVYAVIGLVMLQQVFQIYLFFQDLIPLPDVLQRVLDPFKEMLEKMFQGLVRAETVGELGFVIFVVAVVPAVAEEMLFRGLIQRSIEKVLPGLQAAILAGAVFGLYHFNPFAVVPLVGLGCYFGVLRYRSNSIIIAMTAHFMNNALAAVAAYFHMESETIIGAQSESHADIGAVLVQLVLYLTLFLFVFSRYLVITSPERIDTHGSV